MTKKVVKAVATVNQAPVVEEFLDARSDMSKLLALVEKQQTELESLRNSIPAYRLEPAQEKPPAQWYVLHNERGSDQGFPDMERDYAKYPGFCVPGRGPGMSGFIVMTGAEGMRLKGNIHLRKLLDAGTLTEEWTDIAPTWTDPAPQGFYAQNERIRNPIEMIVFGDDVRAKQTATIRAYLESGQEDRQWENTDYTKILQLARKYLDNTNLPYKKERMGWCTEHLQTLRDLDL